MRILPIAIILLAGNTWGAEGNFDVGPGFPLDVSPFIRSQAGAVNAAINVSSPTGWLATAFTCNWAAAQAPPYCLSVEDERDGGDRGCGGFGLGVVRRKAGHGVAYLL